MMFQIQGLDKCHGLALIWRQRADWDLMKPFTSTLFVFVFAIVVVGQEPAVIRKVVLPAYDSQLRARLAALDGRLNPVHSAQLASTVVGQLANSSPYLAFPPVLGDRKNNDIWEQLADDYYRMMSDSGDALVTTQESAPQGVCWTSEQVRRLCQERLASLPRSVLDQYRVRVHAEAKALIEQGKLKRATGPLRRVADELRYSSLGDTAIDLLGDLLFERGHFEEAHYAWSLVSRGSIIDPRVNLAQLEAKQVLAMIFQGRLDEARTQLDIYRQRHPTARGEFAARDGIYHETLSATLTTFQRERIANNDEPWTTFGGDPSRNRVLSQGLSWSLLEDGASWRAKLPSLIAPGKSTAPRRWDLQRNVAFHPIIVRDQVLIADHRSVVSYHLRTGEEAFRFELKGAGPGVDGAARLPRFTLSADNERVYVRLGGVKVGPLEEPSFLVCLDLTEPEKTKKRELWHIKATAAKSEPVWFEGSPLVHDGRVYAVLSKIVERRVVSSIVCYDVFGRERWSRAVCDAPEFSDGSTAPRHRQHLLTLAGGQIVFATHAGAIVAVDATTGEPTWAVRYPSRGPTMRELEPSPRDLTPCVYADGRVYAAPLDLDRLLCIDTRSGRVCWEAEGVEIVHLLGVAHERVFATTPSGLCVFDANGRIEWIQPSDGRLPSQGRGLLAGGWLYWPTQDLQLPTRTVTMQGGQLMKNGKTASVLHEPAFYDPAWLSRLPAGNWAFGKGCLAIAGTSELVVFTPPRIVPQGPIERPHARLDAERGITRDHARTIR